MIARVLPLAFSWLANLAYVGFLLVGLPWMLWRIAVGKNRRGWGEKLWGAVPRRPTAAPCLWFHAVSVGEVNLLSPVLRELHRLRPDLEVAITTTTETGYDLARQRYPECRVSFCPFDFSWAVRRTLRRLRPQALVLVELELWPNLIGVTERLGIPVLVINGRLSQNSLRGYRRWGWATAWMLRRLTHVWAQNEVYARRFIELGCDPAAVSVTGSVKFDGATTDPDNPHTEALRQLLDWEPGTPVLVAGSTQLEEDRLICQALGSRPAPPGTKRWGVVLVPRHPERCGALMRELEREQIPAVLRSQCEASGDRVPPGHWLVVDVIGELGAWWGLADAGYVGGSMGKREGQNMIEPAAYGVPVCFGPRTRNFRDVVEQLLEREAAEVVRGPRDLREFLDRLQRDPAAAQARGQRARQVVLENVGASQRTVEELVALLPGGSGNASEAAGCPGVVG